MAATDALSSPGDDDRFITAMSRVVAALPFGLDTRVAPTFVGFALINGSGFVLDLSLLTLLHSGFGLPLPVAFTAGYLTSFALSFFFNRRFNFRSHAPAGRQLAVYVVAVAINYAAFILGVADALAAAGLEYHLARVAAACCEGVYMYCALRWIVFR